jgi:hypothetical protein
VVVAGLVILLTGWLWLDPAAGQSHHQLRDRVGRMGLLRDSVGMSMAAVPSHIDPAQVRAFIASQPEVASLHDLHIWPMSTTEVALTCHLVTKDGHPGDAILHKLSEAWPTSSRSIIRPSRSKLIRSRPARLRRMRLFRQATFSKMEKSGRCLCRDNCASAFRQCAEILFLHIELAHLVR